MREGAEHFTEPGTAAQRRYEALRAYFTEAMPAAEVADRFGYSTASVRQMATLLRKGRLTLFAETRPGPKGPRKATGQLRARVLELRAAGHEPRVAELTGLRIDPYFTATKLTWLARAEPSVWAGVVDGSVAVGTVDSYLITRLTGGKRHVSDASNASRTLLFDIASGQWSAELCDLFGVPPHALPEVVPSTGVVGQTDPAAFLGGRRRLERGAAEAAVDDIAAALGIERVGAALGIHRVVNTTMAEGVRLVSVRRGIDPRRFTLLAFGGAAGLHATAIARQLDLRLVVVPRVAAVLSAWGMLATDLRFEVARSHIGDTGTLDGEALKRLFAEMEAEGMARLRTSPGSASRAGFDGPVRVTRSVDMRYGEQVFEIAVGLDGVDWANADPLPQIVERFHRRHEELYTYSLPDQETVLVNARVAVTGILSELPQEPALPETPPATPGSERRIYLEDWIFAPVYDFDALAPGETIAGPAIVEGTMTTVLLHRDERAGVTPLGWLDIGIPAS